MSRQDETPCPPVREVVRRRVANNAYGLAELAARQERMQGALRKRRRMQDGVPDGEAICRLIEAVST
jgi:hypothetical protein